MSFSLTLGFRTKPKNLEGFLKELGFVKGETFVIKDTEMSVRNTDYIWENKDGTGVDMGYMVVTRGKGNFLHPEKRKFAAEAQVRAPTGRKRKDVDKVYEVARRLRDHYHAFLEDS